MTTQNATFYGTSMRVAVSGSAIYAHVDGRWTVDGFKGREVCAPHSRALAFARKNDIRRKLGCGVEGHAF